MTPGSVRRIWAMLYRHMSLYRRSWPRLVEMAYWPVLQMCIWGFTSSFLAARRRQLGGARRGALLGGVLLWRSRCAPRWGSAFSFLEEIWSAQPRPCLRSPLRPWELVASLLGVSLARMFIGVAPAILLAWLLYAFNVSRWGRCCCCSSSICW